MELLHEKHYTKLWLMYDGMQLTVIDLEVLGGRLTEGTACLVAEIQCGRGEGLVVCSKIREMNFVLIVYMMKEKGEREKEEDEIWKRSLFQNCVWMDGFG